MKGGTLLATEFNELLKSILYGIMSHRPLSVGEHLLIGLGHHIWHSQECGEDILRLGNACCGNDIAYLGVIHLHQLLVDRCGL